MKIEISDKDKKDINRLDKTLAAGVVYINDLRDLLASLQRKLTNPSIETDKRKGGLKQARKDHYRNRLK